MIAPPRGEAHTSRTTWAALGVLHASKAIRRTFLGTSKALSTLVPTIVAVTLCFTLGGAPAAAGIPLFSARPLLLRR